MVVGGVADGHHADSRTQAQIDHDAEITNRINRRFVNDPLVPAFDIRVRTYKGIVKLSGMVATEEIRRRALHIVKSTPGVRSVESSIVLR